MSTDTNIKTLIFNKLTQEQYNNADRVPTEFYLTPDTSIDSSEKGAANGVASLDANGKIPKNQIPEDYIESGAALFDLCSYNINRKPNNLFLQSIHDCLYSADKRFLVTLNNLGNSNSNLFDGKFDTYCSLSMGETGSVLIEGPLNLGFGYPYGEIYCSFYSQCGPRDISDVTCRVYQDWSGHNTGWVNLEAEEWSSRMYNNVKSIQAIRFKNKNVYGIKKIELTFNNQDGTVATVEGTDLRICEINYFAIRTNIKSLPIMTKRGGDTIYGNVTIPVQLGSFVGNLTGTADKSVKDGNGNTISSTYIKSSTKGTSNGVATLDVNGKVPTEQIPTATTSTLGGVKPDGNTITVTEDGTISATGGSTTAGRPLGEVYFSQSSLTTDNPGALPGWTGEYYENGKTLFPDLYNFVKAHSELQVTKAQYDSAIATYGECPKYVVDENTAQTSLRLPKYANYIKMANSTEGITQKGAGLPNITGSIDPFVDMNRNWSGALEVNNTAPFNPSGTSGNGSGSHVMFDASKSNAIYGASDTVQPAHTTLYSWISAYTSTIPASVAQSAEFTGALAGKASTDLSNVSANIDYVVESQVNSDGSWYRKYKSGWVEQGGQIANLPTGNNIIYNLLKPFANNNYTLFAQICEVVTWSGDSSVSIAIGTRTTTTFGLSRRFRNIGDGDTIHVLWAARGQGVN